MPDCEESSQDSVASSGSLMTPTTGITSLSSFSRMKHFRDDGKELSFTSPTSLLGKLSGVRHSMGGGGGGARGREKLAELFRKDLISAMKLPDTETLMADDYHRISDQWKEEWEKGVQVPINPDLVKSMNVIMKAENTDMYGPFGFKLPKKYLHAVADDEYKQGIHDLHEMHKLSEQVCRYDLDHLDVCWLESYNQLRDISGDELLTEWEMERIMEGLETRCYDGMQQAMKTVEGLGIEYDESCVCDVCRDPEVEEGNEMVFCDGCDISVHQACYGILKIPKGNWLCRTCALGIKPNCVFCPNTGGAMKCTEDGDTWAHLCCARWIPEVSLGCIQKMEPVCDVANIPPNRWALICSLCRERGGACIQCCVKKCKTSFHVTCAFSHNLDMKESFDSEDATEVQMRAYCEKHLRRKPGDGTGGGGGEGVEGGGGTSPRKTPTKSSPKKESEMTDEEKRAERQRRVNKLAEEFYTYAATSELHQSLNLENISLDTIDIIRAYWILKRKCNYNRPLLTPKVEEGDMLSKQREDSLVARLKMFIHLRQDLERVRNLCYMITRREKIRCSLDRVRHELFTNQLIALRSLRPGTAEYQSVVEVHRQQLSVYDDPAALLEVAANRLKEEKTEAGDEEEDVDVGLVGSDMGKGLVGKLKSPGSKKVVKKGGATQAVKVSGKLHQSFTPSAAAPPKPRRVSLEPAENPYARRTYTNFAWIKSGSWKRASLEERAGGVAGEGALRGSGEGERVRPSRRVHRSLGGVQPVSCGGYTVDSGLEGRGAGEGRDARNSVVDESTGTGGVTFGGTDVSDRVNQGHGALRGIDDPEHQDALVDIVVVDTPPPTRTTPTLAQPDDVQPGRPEPSLMATPPGDDSEMIDIQTVDDVSSNAVLLGSSADNHTDVNHTITDTPRRKRGRPRKIRPSSKPDIQDERTAEEHYEVKPVLDHSRTNGNATHIYATDIPDKTIVPSPTMAAIRPRHDHGRAGDIRRYFTKMDGTKATEMKPSSNCDRIVAARPEDDVKWPNTLRNVAQATSAKSLLDASYIASVGSLREIAQLRVFDARTPGCADGPAGVTSDAGSMESSPSEENKPSDKLLTSTALVRPSLATVSEKLRSSSSSTTNTSSPSRHSQGHNTSPRRDNSAASKSLIVSANGPLSGVLGSGLISTPELSGALSSRLSSAPVLSGVHGSGLPSTLMARKRKRVDEEEEDGSWSAKRMKAVASPSPKRDSETQDNPTLLRHTTTSEERTTRSPGFKKLNGIVGLHGGEECTGHRAVRDGESLDVMEQARSSLSKVAFGQIDDEDVEICTKIKVNHAWYSMTEPGYNSFGHHGDTKASLEHLVSSTSSTLTRPPRVKISSRERLSLGSVPMLSDRRQRRLTLDNLKDTLRFKSNNKMDKTVDNRRHSLSKEQVLSRGMKRNLAVTEVNCDVMPSRKQSTDCSELLSIAEGNAVAMSMNGHGDVDVDDDDSLSVASSGYSLRDRVGGGDPQSSPISKHRGMSRGTPPSPSTSQFRHPVRRSTPAR